MNHSEIVSFLWGVADLIRDTFKRGKYQDVILPLTILRRLDCVLAPNKEKVLKRQAELRGKGLQDLDAQLRKVSGFAFYNTSRYDFDKLLADAPHVAANLRNYIAGFSPNMREVLEKFDFDNTISKLSEAGLLFKVLERFKNVDLHPDKIDNPTMGMIFEELIRKFNEALNENPGETADRASPGEAHCSYHAGCNQGLQPGCAHEGLRRRMAWENSSALGCEATEAVICKPRLEASTAQWRRTSDDDEGVPVLRCVGNHRSG
jgi:hypothetical protein